MLDTVKTYFRIAEITEPPDDEILLLLIEEITQSIRNYCNLNKLPKELEKIAARMVVELWTESQINKAISEPSAQAVSSISEQGRSVSFHSGGAEKIKAMTRAADEKIAKTKELNRFKQLFKLPAGGGADAGL